MSEIVREVVTVERQTQYGIFANGRNYSLSPRLKEKGTTPQEFVVGKDYSIDVWTGPKGGKSINGFTVLGTPVVVTNEIALPPSLPPTTVSTTLPPGGVAPIAAAVKRVNENGSLGRDKSIETQAVLKSVLESPAYAQLVVGKRRDESFQIGADMFTFFLARFYEARG